MLHCPQGRRPSAAKTRLHLIGLREALLSNSAIFGGNGPWFSDSHQAEEVGTWSASGKTSHEGCVTRVEVPLPHSLFSLSLIFFRVIMCQPSIYPSSIHTKFVLINKFNTIRLIVNENHFLLRLKDLWFSDVTVILID